MAGAWLALALTGNAAIAFVAVALGIATFAVGLLFVMRRRFGRLASLGAA